MRRDIVFHGILYALSLALLFPLAYAYCFLAVRLKAVFLHFLLSDPYAGVVVVNGAPFFYATAAGLVLCAVVLLWKRWRYFPLALLVVSTVLWLVLPHSMASVPFGLGVAGVLGSLFALKHLLQIGLLRLSAIAPRDHTN